MWSPTDAAKITSALTATLQICGSREISEMALEMFIGALAEHDPEHVLTALRECYKGHRGHLAPVDIISRIPDPHGWPSDNEAWALTPGSETDTAVWCQEIAEAFETVRQMRNDPTAQRMAFRESYARLIAFAKLEGRAPEWMVSLGHDVAGRTAPIMAAVENGRLTSQQASRHIPQLAKQEHSRLDKLIGGIAKNRQLPSGPPSRTAAEQAEIDEARRLAIKVGVRSVTPPTGIATPALCSRAEDKALDTTPLAPQEPTGHSGQSEPYSGEAE